MEDKKLNEKESLELISQMIRNTQQRLEKVHALPFLVFGYTTVVVSVIVWYLLKTTPNYWWNLLWFLIPIVGFSVMSLLKRNHQKFVRTIIDKAVDYVWLVSAVTVFAASFTPTLWKHVPILFMVALVMSIATTITGLITKVKLMTISGGIAILLSLILPSIEGLDSVLFFGGIFVIMQVIPGHILYYKGKRNDV